MAAIRAAVTYGLDADTYLVAHAVNSALEGAGCHIMVEGDGPEAEIWIARHGQPVTEATGFKAGQQLIVTYDDGWRIEDAPAVAA